MLNSKSIKNYIKNSYDKIFKDIYHKRIFWGVVFCLILIAIIGTSVVPEHINLQEGQPSPRDFEAPRNYTFESQALTNQKRQEAADKVEPIYRTDENVLIEIHENINNYFVAIHSVRESPDLQKEQKVEFLKQQLNFNLKQGIYLALLTMNDQQLDKVQNEINQIVSQYMLPGVLPEDVDLTRKNILDGISLLNFDAPTKEFLKVLIDNVEIKGNRNYDFVSTSGLKEKAAEAVEPVVVKITKNQKIVGKGEIITAQHIETLNKLGVLTSANTLISLAGVVLLALIFIGTLVMQLYHYRPSILVNESSLILIGLLIVSTLLISKAVTAINIGNYTEFSMIGAYAAPVAAGSMLIAILFDGRLAIFITVLLASLIGIMNGIELQFSLVAFFGGLTGIYSVSDLSGRSDIVKASLYIVGVNIITILTIGLILNYSLPIISLALMLGIINGILSSVLTIGTLPFWETAFGVTTSVKLLELSNPNQPLLRRLLLEAPGTYHHSVVVGNMAEAAADAVGANALLARTGANYHDIGKLKRPYFFIENQLTSENPHDKLAPTLSTLIISSHTKDGIDLAKEYGLPASIMDIISQHHGNSVISYFYHKAKEACCEEMGCTEDDFRYDNPKPRTKEAAIVMLADSIEAGVRSMQKPTPNKIEAFVKKIITDKLEDAQLEECELTFKELDIIAQSFTKILAGIFHSRIEYPENVLEEIEKGKNNGNIYKQPAEQG